MSLTYCMGRTPLLSSVDSIILPGHSSQGEFEEEWNALKRSMYYVYSTDKYRFNKIIIRLLRYVCSPENFPNIDG